MIGRGQASRPWASRWAVCIAIVGIGVGTAAWMLLLPRERIEPPIPTLGEPVTFDFGSVILGSGGTVARHSFVLVNRQNHELRIVKVSTTCGCTVAKTDRELIPPNGTVRVDAELTLADPVVKTAQVRLLIEGLERPQVATLTMTALGVRPGGLQMSSRRVGVMPGREEKVLVFCLNNAQNDRPPIPKIVSSPDVVAVAGSWRLVHPSNPDTATPARWGLVLSVRSGEGTRALPQESAPPGWVDVELSPEVRSRLIVDHALAVGTSVWTLPLED